MTQTYTNLFVPHLHKGETPFDHTANIHCPICGGTNVHISAPKYCKSYDSGGCWAGRGDSVTTPMMCEEGHNWKEIKGFHKGQSYLYYEL